MKRIYILIVSVISLIAMSVRASAYEPMVRTDRIWEYYVDSYYPMYDIQKRALAQIRFDKKIEVGNKEYYRLTVKEETRWESVTDSITVNPKEYKPDRVVAFMREENGKIWIAGEDASDKGNGSIFSVISSEEALNSSNSRDLLLYDFTLNVGDSINHFGHHCPGLTNSGFFNSGEYLWPAKNVVAETGTVDVNGVDSKYYLLKYMDSRDIIIEGIGPAQSSLVRPEVEREMTMAGQREFLNGVYDGEGNKIFGKWEFSVPANAGISDVVAPVNADKRMYDLMGREIKEPAPGVVYIQGGRKLIAR